MSSLESLFKVTCPASLTVEALARELYPDAFYEDQEFATDYRAMLNLVRCLNGFGSKPAFTWQTQESHDKQKSALKLAVASMHKRLSDTFYTWACWPDPELNKPESKGHIWYLLSAHLYLADTSKEYQTRKVTQFGRLTPKFWNGPGFDAQETQAIKVSSDDELVHVGINERWGISSYYHPWTKEYHGPASGLMDWLRDNGILAQRVDLVSSDVHHWQHT